MDSSFKGNKRMAIVLEDEDSPLQSSAQEKAETKKNYAQLQAQLFGSTTQLSDVPTEIQEHIIKFILNAHGPTNIAQLYNATEKLRNFAAVNTAYHDWFQDPRLVKIIIQELSQKYGNGNIFEAALAWGTPAASYYLGNEINNAIVAKDATDFEIVRSERAQELITQLNAKITLTLINKYTDAYFLLTQHINPEKLAWVLNGIMISGVSPLTYAILNGMTEIIMAMMKLPGLDYGSDPESVEEISLHAAVKIENPALVHALLQKNSDVINARDHLGNTPLILAVDKNNRAIVELLLARGAHINVLNSAGVSPLIAAVKKGDLEMVTRLMAENNINPNLQGMPPDFPQIKPAALDVAVMEQRPQIVQQLLSYDRTQVNRPAGVDSPLHLVASNGNIPILRMLLAAGAAVDARGSNNLTPLMLAAINNQIDTVTELVAARADVNLRDNENLSALNRAQQANGNEIVNILMQAGATE